MQSGCRDVHAACENETSKLDEFRDTVRLAWLIIGERENWKVVVASFIELGTATVGLTLHAPIVLSPTDRRRHLYVIGKTGTSAPQSSGRVYP